MAASGDQALQVTFFGGEPLLKAELLRRIVALFKNRLLFEKDRRALSWLVTTNGVLLDQPFLEFAWREGVFISLSIDGTPSAHDADRRTANGQSTSAEALRALGRLSTHPDRFSTYSVVTPQNAAVLDSSLRFLFEQGSHVLVTALDLGGAWSRESMEELQRAHRRLAREIWKSEGARGPPW